MKTAISIPDPIFRDAERMAKKLRLSRSELYARALEAYLAAQRRGRVTEALNRVYAEEDSTLNPLLSDVQALSVPREDW